MEANWAAKSAAAPPKTQALVVPLCFDWNGLNDQIALGTQVNASTYMCCLPIVLTPLVGDVLDDDDSARVS